MSVYERPAGRGRGLCDNWLSHFGSGSPALARLTRPPCHATLCIFWTNKPTRLVVSCLLENIQAHDLAGQTLLRSERGWLAGNCNLGAWAETPPRDMVVLPTPGPPRCLCSRMYAALSRPCLSPQLIAPCLSVLHCSVTLAEPTTNTVIWQRQSPFFSRTPIATGRLGCPDNRPTYDDIAAKAFERSVCILTSMGFEGKSEPDP